MSTPFNYNNLPTGWYQTMDSRRGTWYFNGAGALSAADCIGCHQPFYVREMRRVEHGPGLVCSSCQNQAGDKPRERKPRTGCGPQKLTIL